jgi:AraC-like DNA-binding protein
MQYISIPPPIQLAPYVRSFWVLKGEASKEIPYIYRSFADGCPEIICHYNGAFKEITHSGNIISSPLYHLHSQSQHFRRFIATENFSIFGVYLYPFALPQLFNLPSYAVTNHHPDIETLLGQAGKQLQEQMLLAKTTAQRIAITSRFLENRLLQPWQPIHTAIKKVLQGKEAANINQLAYSFNLSTRQFERKFKEQAGFSPKLYSRIARFHKALQQYGTTLPLTQIAYNCGYYDQSHFIRDFKAFSGHHPKTYFSGKAEGTEYLEA